MALASGDLQALRDYVTAKSNMQQQPDSTVLLAVTHSNLKARFMEIRFDRHMTIGAVKNKLCFHTGTVPSAMVLYLRYAKGGPRLPLDDTQMLGYYSPHDGDELHVEDKDPTSLSRNGWLEDTSKVEKYVMSDEDYAKREGTYRKYKEEKLKEDPDWTLQKELAIRRQASGASLSGTPANSGSTEPIGDDFQEAEAQIVPVGSRCEVQGGRRGTVRYVGRCDGLPAGYWIGVQYDEPVGKNDGSIKGHRYFECLQGYGGFVRPVLVSVGDFPPLDDDFAFSDDDEI